MTIRIKSDSTAGPFGNAGRVWIDAISFLEKSSESIRAEVNRIDEILRANLNMLEPPRSVKVTDFALQLDNSSSWLRAVESRIRSCVPPQGREVTASGEWLSKDAASAAITFFRASADLLPSEPHIYPSLKGDLVAEFESGECRMTTVVSGKETLLFAVLSSDPDEPKYETVRRGSNRIREEVADFTEKLSVGIDGQVAAVR